MTLERNLFFLGHRKIVFSLFFKPGNRKRGGRIEKGGFFTSFTNRRGRTDGQKEQEQGGRGGVQGKRGGRGGARENEREKE